MGWASATSIFDKTAQALLNAKAGDEIVTPVLAALIEELEEHDWDTLDESFERFKGNAAVEAAFRQADPAWFEEE